jgi:2-phospho-L-lactate guanylyltransferase
MIVLIPCKSLSAGKSRLSTCLDPPCRRTLCEYFLTRTIELAIEAVGADHVRVVTSDPAAIAVATSRVVSTFTDLGFGLNAALDNARDELGLQGRSPSRLMILPIDLPYASLDAICEAMDTKADLVICPDSGGKGTNLLVLSGTASRFPFSFGAESCRAHSNAARTAGLDVHVINDWCLARDIDEPNQYIAWTKSLAFPRHLLPCQRVEPLAGSATPT